MLRFISLTLCLLMVACQPAGPAPGDLVHMEAEDDILYAQENNHVLDISDLLPLSPIVWDTCSGEENDHPCNLTGPDQYGDNFGLYAKFGHPIVLDFSAGWCGPCRSAAVHVQEVQDLYRDSGLLYITVLIETTNGDVPAQADVAEWADTYGLTDSLVVASSRDILQSGGGTWALSGWPTFYYIDREMVLRDIDRGYNEQEVIHSIDWLLNNF